MDLKKEVKIMQTNTIFSVFVENLSELNEGNMVGCWVEFPCDYDEWKEVLAKIRRNHYHRYRKLYRFRIFTN